MSITIYSPQVGDEVWVLYSSLFSLGTVWELYIKKGDKFLPLSGHEITSSFFKQGSSDGLGNNEVIHHQMNGACYLIPRYSNGAGVFIDIDTSLGSSEMYSNRVGTTFTCRDSNGAYVFGGVYSQSGSLDEDPQWPETFDPGHYDYVITRSPIAHFQTRIYRPGNKINGKNSYPGSEEEVSSSTLPIIRSMSDLRSSSGVYYTVLTGQATAAYSYKRIGTLPYSTTATYSSNASACKLGIVASLPSVDFTSKYAGPAVVPASFLTDLTDKIGPLRVNNAANLMQLRKLSEFIPPLRKMAKLRNIKTLAEFWLYYKYTYNTTKMDIEAMKKFFSRDLSSSNTKGYDHRINLSYHIPSGTDRFHIYLGSYTLGVLDTLGLRPNLSNTWDMIPFSFVVDWFTKIGDSLQSIDDANFLAQIPVISVVSSRTKEWFLPPEKGKYYGLLTCKSYDRSISSTLPASVVSPQLNLPSGHLLDALSLYVANK